MNDPLLDTVSTKRLTFKNRMVHAPTTMNMSDDRGYVTNQAVGAYEALAAGGFGAVCVGATFPLEPGKGWIPGTLSWGPSGKYPIGNAQPGVVSTETYRELVEAYAQGARRAITARCPTWSRLPTSPTGTG